MTAGNPCGTATADVGLKPDLHEVLVSVNILYFAGLREALGQSSEQLSLPAQVGSVGQLHAHLAARGGVWAALTTTKGGGDGCAGEGRRRGGFLSTRHRRLR